MSYTEAEPANGPSASTAAGTARRIRVLAPAPSYKYKKVLQSWHEMDYMEEEAGEVARATLEGGPPVLTIPPCLSRCYAGKQGGSSVDRSRQPFFLVPGWPHPSRELQLP